MSELYGSKEEVRENIQELREEGGEVMETGEDIGAEAEAVASEVHEIAEVDNDVSEVAERLISSYQEAFDAEIEEKVEQPAKEISEKNEEVRARTDEASGEIGEGIAHVEAASGISEVGQDVAGTAAGELAESQEAYQEFGSEAGEMNDEFLEAIDEALGKAGSAF